jgi:hypothetical protein
MPATLVTVCGVVQPSVGLRVSHGMEELASGVVAWASARTSVVESSMKGSIFAGGVRKWWVWLIGEDGVSCL